MKLTIGSIVKGNRYAGLARQDIGVVISASLAPPRSVKVKFLKRGYWLICPDELCEALPHDKSMLSEEFINDALNNSKVIPRRDELIKLLGEALNHIDDNELNRRISETIARHET